MAYRPRLPWPSGASPNSAVCGEEDRLAIMASYGLDALEGAPELSRIVQFAASLCEAPIALVSLVEEERQRFLAKQGLEVGETPRPTSFCAHAMLGDSTMIVPDAMLDPRFGSNPLVTGAPHIRFYAGAPLISSEGAPLGSLCIIDTVPREALSDLQREGLEVLAASVMQRLLIERQDRAAIAALEARQRELQHMLDSVPGIAWSVDHAGNFDMFSARWKEVTGREPPRTADDWADFIHPDDYARSRASWDKAFGEERLSNDEWRLRQADGSYRWVLSRAMPVDGEPGGRRWFGTVIDIDEAHRTSEMRDLLAKELSHRIKNIFAVVSGLVTLHSRGKETVADYAEALSTTIRALGKAHDYVQPASPSRKEHLVGLLDALLAPYRDGGEGRIEISGGDVAIGPRAATPLALIIHELATNAAKYGALSRDGGKVTVGVNSDCDGEGTVCLSWREQSDGFAQAEQASEGFGSRLLRMAVEGQLSGQFTREFEDDGLRVELRIPSASIAG